jgi:hypothetical protein
MSQESLDARNSVLKHGGSNAFWPSCVHQNKHLFVSHDGMFLKTIAVRASFIMNSFKRINRKFSLSCIRRTQVKVGLINLSKGLFSLNARIYYKLKSGA